MAFEGDFDGGHVFQRDAHLGQTEYVELLFVVAGRVEQAVVTPAAAGAAAFAPMGHDLRGKNPRFEQVPLVVEFAEKRAAVVGARGGTLIVVMGKAGPPKTIFLLRPRERAVADTEADGFHRLNGDGIKIFQGARHRQLRKIGMREHELTVLDETAV